MFDALVRRIDEKPNEPFFAMTWTGPHHPYALSRGQVDVDFSAVASARGIPMTGEYLYNATLGREQLFDLARDPHEQRDVAASNGDRCRRLRQRLSAWLSSIERAAP